MKSSTQSDFQTLYRKLLIASVADDVKRATTQASLFESITNEIPTLGVDEARQLLSHASVLASSKSDKDRVLAYEVANRIAQSMRGKVLQSILVAADAIIGQLGFFQSQKLHRDEHPIEASAIPFSLDVRNQVHAVANTVNFATGQAILSDSQLRILRACQTNKMMSFSAPTSAGKTFVLTKYVATAAYRDHRTIVYLVPSRALIRQVAYKLREELKIDPDGLPPIPVRTTPVALTAAALRGGAIYVLTPERLDAMLVGTVSMQIHEIVVDEAQTIADPKRGPVVQGSIERAQRKFPDLRVFFASPLVRNPEILPLTFGVDAPSWVQQVSPVSQNFIIARHTHGNHWKFWLLLGSEEVELCARELKGPKPTTDTEKKAQLAAHIHASGECTILYANKPHYAELAAKALLTYAPIASPPPELVEFAAFVRETVHPDFPLLDYIEQGIAVHYSTIPNFVKTRLEELAETGLVRFLCCTTSLLQGVNFPTRNIIMLNPRKGVEKMTPGEYRNLAGRAGRLGTDFHGNVWIVEPDSYTKALITAEATQVITPAQNDALKDGDSKLVAVIEGMRKRPQDFDEDQREQLLPVVSKLFSDVMVDGRKLGDQSGAGVAPEQLARTERALQDLQDSLIIPPELLARNPYQYPGALDELYRFLMAQPDVSRWVPTEDMLSRPYHFLEQALEVLNRIFAGDESRTYRRDAYLASVWLEGIPLNVILRQDIARNAPNAGLVARRQRIMETIKQIEQRVRFKAAGYLRCYHDVITRVVRDRGLYELEGRARPLHLLMECGTTNPVVLDLISVGFSRLAASAIWKTWRPPKEDDAETYLLRLARMPLIQLEAWRLGADVYQEISLLTGRALPGWSR